MGSKKVLLLDIDYTLFCNSIPRPYLKEFLERMYEKYELGFYTAGTAMRVTDVARILYKDIKLNEDIIFDLRINALYHENCPTIEYFTSKTSSITIKCLQKAADKLQVNKADIILLDDNPKHGHPDADQIIQAHGFNGDLDDTYLKDLDI